MRNVVAVIVLSFLFAMTPAMAQDQPTETDSDSYERLPAQIEESVRDLVDRIQESVRGAVAKAPDPLRTTLALTFQVEGVSGPVRILSADGHYSVNVDNVRTQRNEAGQVLMTEKYVLDVAGTIVDEAESETFRITYAGLLDVEQKSEAPSGESREGHMTLNGSVIVEIGKAVTLAENEEWALTLTVDEVKAE